MSYFKINDNDYSMYTSGLKVSEKVNYNSQTNAAGNTVVDYINSKRVIEVEIIPLNEVAMSRILNDVAQFNVLVQFRNPKTNELESADCIIPSSNIDYYTIQQNNVMYNAFTLTFTEL